MNYLRDIAADDSWPANWPTDAELLDDEAPFPIPSIGTLAVVGLVIGLIASYFWPGQWFAGWLP